MDFKKLKAGDKIYYTGVIYTARDQAHLRLKEMIDNHENIPIDFQNALIYYAGPTPTKPGMSLVQLDQQRHQEWTSLLII